MIAQAGDARKFHLLVKTPPEIGIASAKVHKWVNQGIEPNRVGSSAVVQNVDGGQIAPHRRTGAVHEGIDSA